MCGNPHRSKEEEAGDCYIAFEHKDEMIPEHSRFSYGGTWHAFRVLKAELMFQQLVIAVWITAHVYCIWYIFKKNKDNEAVSLTMHMHTW